MTQMRYLLFVVIGLIGCFPLRAQTPEDNLRDEEYYPFQNGYEEPYSPMIDTDSSLFYRAIQSTGDLFRDATDFKFSFVAYNRRGEPYRPDRMSLNGIRLPSRYIPSMNALYPQKYGEPMNGWHLPTTLDAEYRTSEEPLLPERNAALQFSGRNYLMGLRLTIAENLGRNWDLAATVQGRTGRDLYADGVFSNSLNAAILLSKRFGDRHLFSLLTVVPVSMRSLRTSSTREAFDLTGNPLYNPSWGYQDGKVRSGRIRREAVPLAAAAYRVRLTDATSLAATFTAETGIRRYSSLAWYDAPSPMPDYYRWMPGYQTDPVTRLEMENIWRANDVRYTQIDWDEFYRQNRNSKDGSATYLMEDRVERIANIQLLAEGVTRINERLTVRYGIRAARMDSRFYKQMRDLMGRNYFVDRDYYLIDDGVYGNKLQNDLRHPDRIIREGDRFGYDYDLRRNEIGAGGSLEYRADRLRAFIAAEVGAASVFRRGHYEKELFAGNKSFGKSRALHFAPYLFRASAGYSFSVRHHLEMTVYASSRTPDGDDLFLNLEYNNRPVEDPTEEKRYGAELNYTWSGRNVRFRATLFVVRTADGMQVRHYYDDFYATYSDMAAAGIGTLRYGAEATALIRLAYRWNLTLAASAGRYRYADNPVVTVYADANNEVLDRNATSYMGDCSVGNTPQLTGFAGLNYYGPKGWGVQAEAAWAGNRFVEPSLVRRTSRIARQLAESPEAFELFTRQERLGDAFTLNVTLFKSFYFNASRLTLMLSVRNLLNDRDQLFSGYESPRVRRIRTADTYVYRPLDTRYLYAYPRTFYASISYKF